MAKRWLVTVLGFWGGWLMLAAPAQGQLLPFAYSLRPKLLFRYGYINPPRYYDPYYPEGGLLGYYANLRQGTDNSPGNAPEPSEPGPVPGYGQIPADRAIISVRVPSGETRVWVENRSTSQQGLERVYTSPPLEPGSYTYTLRARWDQNGQEMEQTRVIDIQPGQIQTVDFTQVR